MLITSLAAARACRSRMGRVLASASAMAAATVRKVPMMARAPIFCALFGQLSALSRRHASKR